MTGNNRRPIHRRRSGSPGASKYNQEENITYKGKDTFNILMIQLTICVLAITTVLTIRLISPNSVKKIDDTIKSAISQNVTFKDLNDKVVSLTKTNEHMKFIFGGGVAQVFGKNVKDKNDNKNNGIIATHQATNSSTSETKESMDEHSDIENIPSNDFTGKNNSND